VAVSQGVEWAREAFYARRTSPPAGTGGGGARDALPHRRGRGAGGRGRDARATRAGGSGAPVAASTAASPRSEHATGVTRGRAGVASALNVPRARAGAAARPLPAKHGRFIAVRACKGRDAARAEGCGSHRTSPLAGMGGRGARDALPHWRGREPRRDRCQRVRRGFAVRACKGRDAARAGGCGIAQNVPRARVGAAVRPLRAMHGGFLRCKRARGVTRRGRVGVRLSLQSKLHGIARRTDRIAMLRRRSKVMRDGPQMMRGRFRGRRGEFRLPALLREVIAARNRARRRRRDARGRRADLRRRRMKAVEHGRRAFRRQRESIAGRAYVMPSRF